ncbi:MAG: hypothetical protein KGR17_08305 [Acidobacteria bacterium]|nr:hypothetical protein [Acidobacteriota bacterium]
MIGAELDAPVDLDRYPIHDEATAEALAGPLARAFASRGVAELPGLVPPQTVGRMVAECEAIAGTGHHSEVTNSVYLDRPDPTLGDGDPGSVAVRSSLRAVAADCIPTHHALRRLYEWPPLRAFVGRILGVERLHPYADPLGALNVAEMGPGDELGWHFDQSDFVTSLSIRPAGDGGEFEVVAGLRRPDDERPDEVRAVLDGDTDRVERLPFEPGTLLVFAGRHSLHRVTPVRVGPSRLVGLLAFDTRPDTDSSDRLKLVRYGRTGPRDTGPPATTGRTSRGQEGDGAA